MSTKTPSRRRSSKGRGRLTPEQRQERNERAYGQLTAAIDGLMSEDGWRAMIQSRAWLRRYSFNNLMMIIMQSPDARDVRPLSEWNKLGRRVRAGERAIRIWAPRLRRVNCERATEGDRKDPAKVLAGFILVNVFDVSQTEGADLPAESPTKVRPQLLTGDAPRDLWERIAAQISAKGFTVLRGDAGGGNGVTRYGPRTVTVREDVEPAQAVKTLIHELAHILCDHEHRDVPRSVREVEAESVAYVVCAAVGLTTLPYSVPYVAGWARDRETVTASAERVLAVADTILAAVENVVPPEQAGDDNAE